jgi:RNA polymerase sigma factor (sigma-70 family)
MVMVYPPLVDPVDTVVVEKHRTKRPHQRIPDAFKCDTRGCKVGAHTKVARALSREWTAEFRLKRDKYTSRYHGTCEVLEKGEEFYRLRITSRVVLAEVVVSDYKTKAAAMAAVRAMAKKKPLNLDILNQIKRPLEHGYTEMEIFHAIYPYVSRHAKAYANHHFPQEDAEQEGWEGIRNALTTDLAMAPFASHAYLHIRTKIRRASYESGLIRKGERECDSHGTKGGQVGFQWQCHGCGELMREEPDSKTRKVKGVEVVTWHCIICGDEVQKQKKFGVLTSADAELGDAFTLKDAMETEEDGPLEVVMEADLLGHKQQVIRELMDAAGFSDQQLEVLVLRFGLEGEALTGTETAKKLDISRQRVGQQYNKCMEKLRAASDSLGYDWDLIDQ